MNNITKVVIKNELVLKILAFFTMLIGFVSVNLFNSTNYTQTYAVITKEQAKTISKRLFYNLEDFGDREEFFYGCGNSQLEEDILEDMESLIYYFDEEKGNVKQFAEYFWEELNYSIWDFKSLSETINWKLIILRDAVECSCGVDRLPIFYDEEKRVCVDVCSDIEYLIENSENNENFIKGIENNIDFIIKCCDKEKEKAKRFAKCFWDRLDLIIKDIGVLPNGIKEKLIKFKQVIENSCGVEPCFPFKRIEKEAVDYICGSIMDFSDDLLIDSEFEKEAVKDMDFIIQYCLNKKERAKRFAFNFWSKLSECFDYHESFDCLPNKLKDKISLFEETVRKSCGGSQLPPIDEIYEEGGDFEDGELDGNEDGELDENNEIHANNLNNYRLIITEIYGKLY